jgi:ribosomal protein S18 acetylase RimI-like enzyme
LFAEVVNALPYYNAWAKSTEIDENRPQNLTLVLEEFKHAVIIAVDKKQKIVGLSISHIDHGTLWVNWICVRKEVRRQEVASRLLYNIIETATRSGLHKVWCDCRTSNKAMINLLTKEGFRLVTTLKKHWYGQDFLLWEYCIDPAVIVVPPSRKLAKKANKHAVSIFGDNCVSWAKYEKWLNQNPYILMVLRSGRGTYLGYLDLLPLEETESNRLMRGVIDEREINPKKILSPTKMQNAKTLYLSGICVKDAGTEEGKARTAKLLLGMVEYLDHYYGTKTHRAIAIVVTQNGKRLIESLGAKPTPNKIRGKKPLPVYELLLTPELLARVKKRALKRTSLARLEFKPIVKADKSFCRSI